MDPYSWSFTTVAPEVPTVTETSPAKDATDVPVDAVAKATFSEAVSEAQISVKDAQGAAVAGASAMDAEGKVLTFTPQQPLVKGVKYMVEVTGAKDAEGNTLAAPHAWSFTTVAPDTTAPTVTETSPAKDATDVPVDAVAKATFSEAVSEAQISVKDAQGAAVAGASAMDAEGKVLTFTPQQPLVKGVKYMVEVTGAKDAEGNTLAAPHAWSFTTVKPPTSPDFKGHWKFDEGSGTITQDASGHGNTATLQGTAGWGTGRTGQAMASTGYPNYAQTAGPVIRTDDSYTIGAWIRFKDRDKSYQVAVQNGVNRAPFYLGSDPTNGLSFLVYKTDTTAWSGVGAYSRIPAPLNEWVHVAGVYNKAAGSISVYVNGQHSATTNGVPALWHANAPMTIGHHINGDIDDVRIYQKALTGAEISGMYALRGHWKFDEGSGTIAQDASGHGNTATLQGTAGWGTGRTGQAMASTGYPNYAQTAGPVIRTDDSYTIGAWIRFKDRDKSYQVAVQNGVNRAPFYLGSDPTNGLSFLVYKTDTTAWSGVGAYSRIPAPLNEWVHVAGVYNKAAGSISVYVNGQHSATTNGVPALWHANAPMTIGHHINGDIDDVRIYQKALSGSEISTLASGASTARLAPLAKSVPAAESLVSTLAQAAPTVSDLQVTSSSTGKDKKGITSPSLSAAVYDPQGRASDLTVEVEHDPAASSQGKGLIWAGSTKVPAGAPVGSMAVPDGKLANDWLIRWRARAVTGKLSSAWSGWQHVKVGAPAAHQRPISTDDVASLSASTTTSEPTATASSMQKEAGASSAAAQTEGFDYEHPNLETCAATPGETNYAEYDARIQERPYSSCWSAYLYIQHYEEDPDTRKKKPAFKSGPAWVGLAKSVIDAAVTAQNDDALRFRATWVAHSYLGDATGNGVVNGGTTGLKPHDIQVFTRIDEIALVDKNGRVKVPGNKLSGLFMDVLLDADTKDEGDCDTGDPGGIRDIGEWAVKSDEKFMIKAEGSPEHNTICSFIPQISLEANGPGNFKHIPLYSQKVQDKNGKFIDVLRHGSGEGEDKRWVPNFRCDWQVFGLEDPDAADHKYACINTRSKRVFVMSKTRDAKFAQVIKHIEDALNVKDGANAKTYPPVRDNETQNPPLREFNGSEKAKKIPGDWAAPEMSDAGKPLIRVKTKDEKKANRAVFSGRNFKFVAEGVKYGPGSNYCKYYFADKYEDEEYRKKVDPRWGELQCDEYPFATTEQGAASPDWDYSLRALGREHNGLHGSALNSFYSKYRVGGGNPFWVMIEP
ncbi:LamG-like jellyroll fold domain-containing protein [Planomonospora algeriensis]